MLKKMFNIKVAVSIFIVALLIALILNPTRYIQSVYGGFILFATNVLPALFPFFFFTKVLTAMGTATILSTALRSPVKLLYNAPPSSAYIFVMSLLSGYPISSKLISEYYKEGLITVAQAKVITAFTSTSGPIFIIGTVGSIFFKNTKVGYIILISHYLGAIVNGLIYRKKQLNNSEILQNQEKIDYDNMLSDAVTSSIQNILIVGSYIALFSMVIDFCYEINLFKFINSITQKLGINSNVFEILLVSLIEMTRGIMMLSNTSLPLLVTVPIACGIVSFGGLCVTLQSVTFLSKAKVKTGFYLLTKTTQAIISALICIPFALLL